MVLAEVHHHRSRAQVQLDQAEAALLDSNEAVRLDPTKPDYLWYRGHLLIDKKKFDEALADFNSALSIDSRHTKAYLGRYEVWFRQKNYPAAFKELNLALAIEPNSKRALLNRASLYMYGFYCDRAITDYELVVLNHPSDDSAAGELERIKRSKVRGNCKNLADGQVPDFPVQAATNNEISTISDEGKWKLAMNLMNSGKHAEALPVLRLLADQGHYNSQCEIGKYYFHGQGVAVNYKEARSWFTKLAEKGDQCGQYFLGIIFEDGLGTPKNYVEAIRYYRLVADKGHSQGQWMLARMYSLGRGVTKDEKEAFRQSRLAAYGGIPSAQNYIAWSYYLGTGIRSNSLYGYAWLTIAAANGHVKAKETLSETEKSMSQDEIAKGQALAAQCTSSNFKDCKI